MLEVAVSQRLAERAILLRAKFMILLTNELIVCVEEGVLHRVVNIITELENACGYFAMPEYVCDPVAMSMYLDVLDGCYEEVTDKLLEYVMQHLKI